MLNARPAIGAQVGDETSASSSSLNVEGVDVADNTIPSHHVSNLRLSYDMEAFGSETSVFLAVTDVFDKNQGDLQMLPSIFDVVGRNYSVGFNIRL